MQNTHLPVKAAPWKIGNLSVRPLEEGFVPVVLGASCTAKTVQCVHREQPTAGPSAHHWDQESQSAFFFSLLSFEWWRVRVSFTVIWSAFTCQHVLSVPLWSLLYYSNGLLVLWVSNHGRGWRVRASFTAIWSAFMCQRVLSVPLWSLLYYSNGLLMLWVVADRGRWWRVRASFTAISMKCFYVSVCLQCAFVISFVLQQRSVC